MNYHAWAAALVLTVGLTGCGHSAPPPPIVVAQADPPPPAPVLPPARPPGLRPDLDAHWIGPDGQLLPPPEGGFNAPPVFSTLQPGRVIDQFGGPDRIFSPRGEPFEQRALPTQCETQPYAVYRVLQPLPVTSGKAAAWFDQPGGATRYETEETSDALVAQHILEPVPDPGPPPCHAP